MYFSYTGGGQPNRVSREKLPLDTRPRTEAVSLCPWLKGSSTLEVFGIDCWKLHRKPPRRGMLSLFRLTKAGKVDSTGTMTGHAGM
ncbi:hypothetical protein EYF80_017181 [Liparis tanakae]|uniref:Uncharacterized protein n=1 Tax=Liparis tanakae TaxID=230148 RepID=A0A4Z2I5J1_9TELE|nr:hypothetical protein EYF80_017181 [Liparis tanakae]